MASLLAHGSTIPCRTQSRSRTFTSIQHRPAIAGVRQHMASKRRDPCVIVKAEGRNSDSSFVTGFVLGGVVFGALGFLFAPQISKTILGDDQRLKLPRFLEDEQAKDPEQTKQDLIEKIAQLNASIDEVAAQLKVKDDKVEETVKVA